jgi:hypothetical protein
MYGTLSTGVCSALLFCQSSPELSPADFDRASAYTLWSLKAVFERGRMMGRSILRLFSELMRCIVIWYCTTPLLWFCHRTKHLKTILKLF